MRRAFGQASGGRLETLCGMSPNAIAAAKSDARIGWSCWIWQRIVQLPKLQEIGAALRDFRAAANAWWRRPTLDQTQYYLAQAGGVPRSDGHGVSRRIQLLPHVLGRHRQAGVDVNVFLAGTYKTTPTNFTQRHGAGERQRVLWLQAHWNATARTSRPRRPPALNEAIADQPAAFAP